MTTSTVEPLGDYRPDAGVRRPARHRACRHRVPPRATAATSARASSSATARAAASSCGSTSRPHGRPTPSTLRQAFAPTAAQFAHELRAVGGPGAVPHADHGAPSSCTASTTCCSGRRPATCRSRCRWWSPTTATPSRWRGTTASTSTTSRSRPTPRPQAEAELLRPGRRPRHRPGRAGPLHADPVRRPVPAAERPGDQHPPLVPAELQGRQALPPGLRPRREAGRRDRALRHRRPRRGPDHRAGRHPRRPHARAPTSWSPPAATSRRRCSPAPCAGTPRPGSCSTAAGRSSSADTESAQRGIEITPSRPKET